MVDILWRSVKRESLTEALFGISSRSDFSDVLKRPVGAEEGKVSVAFSLDSPYPYSPPLLAVFPDESSSDLFAWMKVYAPETSPISQFCRVLNHSDFQDFHELARRGGVGGPRRTDQWACLILGEILSQGDSEAEVKDIPQSRSSACFTTVMARSMMVYGLGYPFDACVDRLVALESEARFVKRQVTVSRLLPAWQMLYFETENISSGVEAARFVLQKYLSAFENSAVMPNGMRFTFDGYGGLFSDSIEERVTTFHRLAGDISFLIPQPSSNEFAGVMLAIGAFLVGRSTSHVFLLRRYAKGIPSLFAWFGLVAAFAGPKCWDSEWSKVTKGIERGLRTKFEWTDPPAADLCWAEFVWLANSFQGPEMFSDMPKISPKVLSIEVMPGITCQFRLASGQNSSAETEHSLSQASLQQDKRMKEMALELAELTVRYKDVLTRAISPPAAPVQQSLGLAEEPPYKNARPKKGKNF
jgi:hypothetical protein